MVEDVDFVRLSAVQEVDAVLVQRFAGAQDGGVAFFLVRAELVNGFAGFGFPFGFRPGPVPGGALGGGGPRGVAFDGWEVWEEEAEDVGAEFGGEGEEGEDAGGGGGAGGGRRHCCGGGGSEEMVVEGFGWGFRRWGDNGIDGCVEQIEERVKQRGCGRWG